MKKNKKILKYIGIGLVILFALFGFAVFTIFVLAFGFPFTGSGDPF